MAFIDYYAILGVEKKATKDAIKKAYRKLARKYHPDLNPNDKEAENKFKEINEANEVIGNPENRKKYDKYGKDWEHADEIEKARQQNKSRKEYDRKSSSNFSGTDYSDFFESMFGGSGSSSGNYNKVKYKGQDINAEMHLAIKDVYKSHQQVLDVNGNKIRLTIPAGVENGQTIRIKGKGGEGLNGGPSGDLFIRFIVSNRTKFKRDGSNLHTSIDLDMYTSILGGEINIDTFDGKVKLKIKPETQNGTKVKLKGKGFPLYKKENQFGDLIITYNVKLPTSLSEKEKDLFKELKKMRTK